MAARADALESRQTAAPRPGLRERKRQRLRREIVEISLDLFERCGYENTRVVDIVDELDISQPTFFRYFPSKAAVLYEAASMHLEEPLAQVPALRADATSTTAYLKGLVGIYADAIVQQPALARMIAAHGGTDTLRSFMCATPTASEAGEHHDGKFYEQMNSGYLLEAIEDGQKSGSILSDLPASQLRAMLWSMLLAIVVEWAFSEGLTTDLHKRFDATVDLFVKGCGAA